MNEIMAHMTQDTEIVIVVRAPRVTLRNNVMNVKSSHVTTAAHFARFFHKLGLSTVSPRRHMHKLCHVTIV